MLKAMSRLLVLSILCLSCLSARSGDEARLPAPESGRIPVAFVVGPGATVIDFAGPWEVFQDVTIPGRAERHAFRLYTVSASRKPIRASAGLQIIPDYTFEDAPAPKVIVVGAQSPSPGLYEWLKKASTEADMTMSVCTGAFILARAGLLDGRRATTHHDFLGRFERSFRKVKVSRDVRFVEGPNIATAGGLTSGIDLALRVVSRYFGEEAAGRTAEYMEYGSDGWKPHRGIWDASEPTEASMEEEPEDLPVLGGFDPIHLIQGREVKGQKDIRAVRGAYTYVFENAANRDKFLADPERYEVQMAGACAAMAKMGARAGSGDPDRFLVYEKRIYIFASAACREHFNQAPERFID